MDSIPAIVPMRERRYEELAIDKIKVINTRNRDKEQFDLNVQSIEQIGLLKPVRVNDKFVERSGSYELICGEGRLLASRRLGQTTIVAEVVTCTRKEAYLQSLVENMARTKPDSMDFARELKRLKDEGWSFSEIARIACKSDHYIRDYVRLVEQGEERLIHGVEQGVFPIRFATQVASTDDNQLQHVLMDAFDAGLVTTNNFAQARRIITARARDSKTKKTKPDYSVTQLRQDISDATPRAASRAL